MHACVHSEFLIGTENPRYLFPDLYVKLSDSLECWFSVPEKGNSLSEDLMSPSTRNLNEGVGGREKNRFGGFLARAPSSCP